MKCTRLVWWDWGCEEDEWMKTMNGRGILREYKETGSQRTEWAGGTSFCLSTGESKHRDGKVVIGRTFPKGCTGHFRTCGNFPHQYYTEIKSRFISTDHGHRAGGGVQAGGGRAHPRHTQDFCHPVLRLQHPQERRHLGLGPRYEPGWLLLIF